MMLIVFALLLAGCLALWTFGAPSAAVFPVALAVWVAFTFLLLPKVRSYKLAMGIDDQLNALEARGWACLLLRFKGLKVLIFGFATSMVPFVGSVAQWLSGQNISFFFDPNNPRAQQSVMFVIGAIIFMVPFLTSWLHAGAIADAASTEPARGPRVSQD